MAHGLLNIFSNEGNSQVISAKKIYVPPALIDEGKSFDFSHPTDRENLFLKLPLTYASVVCGRSSPKKEALVSTLEPFDIIYFYVN